MSVRTARVERLIEKGRLHERAPLPSSEETRDRIVNHLRGLGWVPIADLVPFLRGLGLTHKASDKALRTLLLVNRLERRATATEGSSWLKAYEYRVVDP